MLGRCSLYIVNPQLDDRGTVSCLHVLRPDPNFYLCKGVYARWAQTGSWVAEVPGLLCGYQASAAFTRA